jgi:hypothetical protein
MVVVVSIAPAQNFAVSMEDLLSWQQQDKETLFKKFNDKKRSDPKDAYRVAKLYLENFGKDNDDNTKYVKEWVVAYEAVMSRTGATDSKVGNGGTNKPDSTAASSAKISDINSTTWQMKGKEDAKTWAEIFVFKPGGRFQYEKYGVDGSSNVRAGTWRQLDESIFATLLGPDGNTIGTVRAEMKGSCLQATLTLQGQPDWRFLMETDTAPGACKDEREAELRKESDPSYARKLLLGLVQHADRKIGQDEHLEIFKVDGCVISSESVHIRNPEGFISSLSYTIPVSEIDSSTIKVGYNTEDNVYGVGFETKNGQKTIKLHYKSSVGGFDENDSMEEVGGFAIGESQENANRAAKVLAQIVKACQNNQ